MINKNQFTLTALLVAFALPPLAAYILYFSNLMPTGNSNKGNLISPIIEVPAIPPISNQSGNSQNGFLGRWNIVMLVPKTCEQLCQKNIYLMRQVQTALGKEENRVRRFILVESSDFEQKFQRFLNDFPKLRVMQSHPDLIASFQKVVTDYQQRIFIIDPLGNLMMHYAEDFDPKDLLSDLKRLIMVNKN